MCVCVCVSVCEGWGCSSAANPKASEHKMFNIFFTFVFPSNAFRSILSH